MFRCRCENCLCTKYFPVPFTITTNCQTLARAAAARRARARMYECVWVRENRLEKTRPTGSHFTSRRDSRAFWSRRDDSRSSRQPTHTRRLSPSNARARCLSLLQRITGSGRKLGNDTVPVHGKLFYNRRNFYFTKVFYFKQPTCRRFFFFCLPSEYGKRYGFFLRIASQLTHIKTNLLGKK